MANSHGYGWRPDTPDQRDHLYASLVIPSILPREIDLRPNCPPVYDQGNLGSCTANAIGGLMEYVQMREKLPNIFVPSRLFIYYNERVMENTVDSDAGAEIRDGIKSVNQLGACPEDAWPYNVGQFAVKPPDDAYAAARNDIAKSYSRIHQNIWSMKMCLNSGNPFAFGFSVYDSFESDAVAHSGMVPMPSPSESLLGGHAVLCVGYRDVDQRFIVRNSWGENWGEKGYFFIPFSYLTRLDLASDFWTIQTV